MLPLTPPHIQKTHDLPLSREGHTWCTKWCFWRLQFVYSRRFVLGHNLFLFLPTTTSSTAMTLLFLQTISTPYFARGPKCYLISSPETGNGVEQKTPGVWSAGLVITCQCKYFYGNANFDFIIFKFQVRKEIYRTCRWYKSVKLANRNIIIVNRAQLFIDHQG